MSARIAIDAHYLGFRQSGNETYVRNLLRGIADENGSHDFDVYVCNRDVIADPPVASENMRYRYVHPSPLWRIPVGLPLGLALHPADILQAHYNAPLFVPCRLVLVMHDISWALMPELFAYLKGRQIAWRAGPSVRKAAKIVVASHAMKEQVRDYYGLSPDRIAVVPLGVEQRFRPVPQTEARALVERAYGVTGPYVLYVGDLQPRKNLPRLVEAFARVRAEGVEHRLVIAGKKAWDYEALFAAVHELGIAEAVTFTGFIADEDLPALYSAASLFAYPSLYEGFGLPPLEAMACGTPTAVSNEATLIETAGGAALLFDPLSVDDIARAIHAGLTDEPVRASLRERGFAHAGAHGWDATARLMLAVYDEILAT